VTATADRLASIHRLADFEAEALRTMEPDAYDYVAGGAWDEETLADNEAAWTRYLLRPRVLVDVNAVDTSSQAFKAPIAMPLAIAPMAVHGLAHPDAEVATARAAAIAGVPFTLSTMSTCSIEAVAAAAPDGNHWFQLYTQSDVARTRSLVERAETAGFTTLMVTVDLPVLGYRVRELRTDFRLDVPLGNLDGPGEPAGSGATHADHGPMSPSLTWADLATIRGWSSMRFVLKGIMTEEDALIALDHGIDGIVVSNHGARQLDRTQATADVLAEIVDAVGDGLEVWVDGGIRRGIDILAALALGARGVLVGRPILWALATAGQAGVERALEILRTELEVGLALLGTPSPRDVSRSHVMARPSSR